MKPLPITITIMLTLAILTGIGASACATTQPSLQQVDDSVITARVASRLTVDPGVKRYEVDVDTIAGVVTLRGKVDSETMKASAERLARDTDGVRSVVNDLTVDNVTFGERVKDNNKDLAIKACVGLALSGNDDVRRVNIDVDITDGIVTLSGVVHNRAEKQAAGRDALACDNVVAVRNALTVESDGSSDPEKLGKVDQDGDRKPK